MSIGESCGLCPVTCILAVLPVMVASSLPRPSFSLARGQPGVSQGSGSGQANCLDFLPPAHVEEADSDVVGEGEGLLATPVLHHGLRCQEPGGRLIRKGVKRRKMKKKRGRRGEKDEPDEKKNITNIVNAAPFDPSKLLSNC